MVLLDKHNLVVMSYVAQVNGRLFAISMLEKFLWVFEVKDPEFIEYTYLNGKEILLEEAPDEVYKCFSAAFLVIAEKLSETENWSDG